MILSILTMTQYDPDIWEDAVFPAEIDRDDMIDRICLDCAELELLYSDPDILKYMIRNWCRTEQHIWQKLADTLDLTYNPIYNLDVTYEETRTPDITRTRTPNLHESTMRSDSTTRSPNLTEERTPNLTETDTPNTTTTETPADTTTDSKTGFNDATWNNYSKSTRSGNITTTETGTDTVTTTGTDTVKKTGSETTREILSGTNTKTGTETEKESGSETVNVRRYGNQGVTMTQDMIQKERDIVIFSLYSYIMTSFKNRFCLLIY